VLVTVSYFYPGLLFAAKTGANTAGANTAGANTAGANTAGANTAGAITAGATYRTPVKGKAEPCLKIIHYGGRERQWQALWLILGN
jgi:hypothetical protein